MGNPKTMNTSHYYIEVVYICQNQKPPKFKIQWHGMDLFNLCAVHCKPTAYIIRGRPHTFSHVQKLTGHYFRVKLIEELKSIQQSNKQSHSKAEKIIGQQQQHNKNCCTNLVHYQQTAHCSAVCIPWYFGSVR